MQTTQNCNFQIWLGMRAGMDRIQSLDTRMIGLLRHGLHQVCDLQVPISRSTLTYTHEAVRPLRRSSCSCRAEALTMRRNFPPELAFTLELVSGV